jgi:hypothetical protein
MDLDYLLSPYVPLEETIIRWKEYLKKENRPTTQKEMESLAVEINTKYQVPKSSISALFNRSYRPHSISERKFPILCKFTPPSFKGTEKFEFSDLSLIDEIAQRLSYPIGQSPDFGPNNGDLDSSPVWCHDFEDTYEGNVNHGMTRCSCFIDIHEDFYICSGCRKKVDWSVKEFIRVPIVGDSHGGWGDFYCSKVCLLNFVSPTQMQDLIIDVSENCIT